MHDSFKLEGKVLGGKYRVDQAIGEGGFGIVYRGFHLTFEHPIAIKCLKIPAHFAAEAQKVFFERFREEGKLLSKLSSAHLSIVRVFDFGVAESARGAIPYLVLEWLEGTSLDESLKERRAKGKAPHSEREAVLLMGPAIEAIATAHSMNVAHRDIKPPNIFVLPRAQPNQSIKVLDFGIAKAMQEGETATQITTKTSSGFSAFSPQYGAPEQFFAKRFGSTGPWTDVYALGLCLVELVTGRAPLDGEEAQEFFESSTADPRPTPRARGATVSDAFENVCAKALAKMPKNRFQDAGALLAALNKVLQDSPAASEVAQADDGSRATTIQKKGVTEFGAPRMTELAGFQVPKEEPKKTLPNRRAQERSLSIYIAPALVVLGTALWFAFKNPDSSASEVASSTPPRALATNSGGLNPSMPSALAKAPSAESAKSSAPALSPLVLAKGEGEGMVIAVGQWKSFSVTVTRDGKPVPDVQIAWRTPALGPITNLSTTDAQGVSRATQVYSSKTAGQFTQTASIVTDGATEGPTVVFDFQQVDPNAAKPDSIRDPFSGPNFVF